MLYLFIAAVVLVISFYASTQNKSKYLISLKVCYCLVFFVWGFEYFNTVDYNVMLEKYNLVNYNIFSGAMFEDDIEPVSKILLILTKPIGNIGYYVVAALFEVLCFYFMTKNLIQRKFIWIFFILLLINFDNVICMMTLKRQFLSTCVSFLALYILVNNKKNNQIYAFLLLLIAFNIHRSAFFNFLIFPLYHFKYRPFLKGIYFMIPLFFIQYFVNISTFSVFLFDAISINSDKYAHYANQLEVAVNFTPVYILYRFMLYVIFLFSLSRVSNKELPLIYCSLFYLLTYNFLSNDIGRMLLLYNLSIIFTVPIILNYFKNFKIRALVISYVVLVSFRLLYNGYTDSNPFSMTYGYKEFNTIFEASSLQIDNPIGEKSKFLRR